MIRPEWSVLLALADPPGLRTSVQSRMPSLVEAYIHLYRNPELSHRERQRSAYPAAELRKVGCTVAVLVDIFENLLQACDIVAFLVDGPGPRVLTRAEMDALPIVEQTA